MAAIEARGLVKRFGETTAVDGVSFDVAEGEIFALLGPNGAGKSTTIRMLCTLMAPTAGTARVAGHDVARESDAVRRSIGLVADKLVLYRGLSVRDNMRFFGRLYGLPRSVIEKRIDEHAAMLRMEPHLEQKIEKLSTGLRQRANVLRALLSEPRILFLDEPTLGLDVQSTRDVRDFVLQINRERGTTVILTTHMMAEVELMAHRVCVIDAGKIVLLGSLADLKREHGIASGRALEATVRGGAEAAVPFVRAAPGVVSCTASGETLRVVVNGPVHGALAALSRAPGEVQDVRTTDATLEDVFLRVTGREMRDRPKARPQRQLLRGLFGRKK